MGQGHNNNVGTLCFAMKKDVDINCHTNKLLHYQYLIGISITYDQFYFLIAYTYDTEIVHRWKDFMHWSDSPYWYALSHIIYIGYLSIILITQKYCAVLK